MKRSFGVEVAEAFTEYPRSFTKRLQKGLEKTPRVFVSDLCSATRKQRELWQTRLKKARIKIVKTLKVSVSHVVIGDSICLDQLRKKYGEALVDYIWSHAVILTDKWPPYYLTQVTNDTHTPLVVGDRAQFDGFAHRTVKLWREDWQRRSAQDAIGGTSPSDADSPNSTLAKDQKIQNSFACWLPQEQRKHECYNEHIAGLFEEYLKILENTGPEDSNEFSKNEFRIIAYRRCVAALRKLKHRVQLDRDGELDHNTLLQPGIPGSRGDTRKAYYGIPDPRKKPAPHMLLYMKEILTCGNFSRLDGIRKSKNFHLLEELRQIHGVGVKTANALIEKHGIVSLDELRPQGSKHHVLNPTQKIGIAHYNDLLLRMKRSEVEEIRDRVQEGLCHMGVQYERLECIAAGSYRRGKLDCGDVDILIKNDLSESSDHILQELVRVLSSPKVPLITDDLALHSRAASEVSENKSTYMGVCKLGKGRRHRRIDIKIYKSHLYAFALLYFTGDSYYNRSLRSYARRMKNLSLSDNGFKLTESRKQMTRIDVPSEEFIERANATCDTEEKVLEVLGVPYRAPDERGCLDAYQTVDYEVVEGAQAQAKTMGLQHKDSASSTGDSC